MIPLLFLRGKIPLAIWIYPDADFEIYPPTWASQGVDLGRLFFVKSDRPVKQLRPLFLENTFKIVIIDTPRHF